MDKAIGKNVSPYVEDDAFCGFEVCLPWDACASLDEDSEELAMTHDERLAAFKRYDRESGPFRFYIDKAASLEEDGSVDCLWVRSAKAPPEKNWREISLEDAVALTDEYDCGYCHAVPEETITDEVLASAVREACRQPNWKAVYDKASPRAKKCFAMTFLLLFKDDVVENSGDEFGDKMYDVCTDMNVAEWEYVLSVMRPLSSLFGPLVKKFEKELVRATEREAEKGGECLRAFTVHPGWAWAIMTAVKKQEWRSFLPNPREGMCAIHVSKSYTRAQWEREAEFIKESWGRNLIPYEELVAEWCGKVVGVCNYAAG